MKNFVRWVLITPVCVVSIDLWSEIQDWIQSLGMENYNLSQSRIVLGDMENAMAITTIILLTKKNNL